MAQSIAFGANIGPGKAYAVRLPKPPAPASPKFTKPPTIHSVSNKYSIRPPKQSTAFGTSGSGITSSSADIFSGLPKPSPATATQMLQKIYEKQQPTHSSGGVLNLIEGGGKDILGGVLNVLRRTGQASAGLALAEVKNESTPHVLQSGLAGLEDKQHHDYADVVKTLFPQFAREHKVLTGVAGFAGDVAFDPLSYLGGAGLYRKLGEEGFVLGFKGFKGLNDVEKGSAVFGGKFGGQLAAHQASMAEKALAPKIASGVATHEEELAHSADLLRESQLQRMSMAEHQATSNKYLGLRLGPTRKLSVTLQTPFKIGGTDEARRAFVEGTGKIGKIPGGTLAGRAWGAGAHVFKPGYLDRVTHAATMTARHGAERLDVETWRYAMAKLAEHSHMGVPEQQKALIAAEKKGTVDSLSHEINSSFLREKLAEQGFHGKELDKAEAFVKSWHDVSEHLRVSDARHGIVYKKGIKGDRVYIPHMLERGSIARRTVTTSNLSKTAFEENAKKLTYEQQLEKAKQFSGAKGRGIIQDPMELLAHRVANGARGQAHAISRETIRRAYGEAKHLRNPALRDKAFRRVDKMERTLASHKEFLAKAERRPFYHRMLAGQARAKLVKPAEKKLHDATMAHAHALERLDKATGRAIGSAQAAVNRTAKAMKAADHEYRTAVFHGQFQYADTVNRMGIEHAKKAAAIQKDHDRIEAGLAQQIEKAHGRMYERNPKYAEGGRVPISALSTHEIGPSGKVIRTIQYSVPHQLAEHIQNVETAISDPVRMDGLEAAFRKSMAQWKILATSVNPGYRIRNSLSDLWNMYIAGVPLTVMPYYAARATKMMKLASGAEKKLAQDAGTKLSSAELKALKTMRNAHDHGVLSGLFLGDVNKRVAMIRGKRVGPYGKVTGVATRANANAENWGRLVHYLFRTEGEHMNQAAAAEQVRIAHFDYEDLTPTEQRTFKMIAPFYTWTRKNIPYQIMSIARYPGRVASYGKLAQESSQASGAKPSDVIGTALGFHPLAFRLGHGYVDPQVGLNDLYNAEHPAQLAQNLLGPQFQIPLEQLLGHTLGGTALTGPDAAHQATPAPGWLAGILGMGGTRTQRMVGGKELAGPGIGWRQAEILSQVPLGSYLLSRNKVSEAAKGQGIGPVDPRTMSYLFGLSYTVPDPANEAVFASIADSKNFKSWEKNRRDQGIIPNATYKTPHSGFDDWLSRLLRQRTQSGGG